MKTVYNLLIFMFATSAVTNEQTKILPASEFTYTDSNDRHKEVYKKHVEETEPIIARNRKRIDSIKAVILQRPKKVDTVYVVVTEPVKKKRNIFQRIFTRRQADTAKNK